MYDIRLTCTTTTTTGRRRPPPGARAAAQPDRRPARHRRFARRSRRRPPSAPTSPISSAITSPRSPIAKPHDELDVSMSARVVGDAAAARLDVSPRLPSSPTRSPRSGRWPPTRRIISWPPASMPASTPAITAYARESLAGDPSVQRLAERSLHRIHDDFAYDNEATTVDTRAAEAFKLKRGVCQDFSHVMIAGLRGLGIPAGYVCGFLRTIPPRARRGSKAPTPCTPGCGSGAGAGRLARVRPDQRHARRRRPHHRRPRPRLFRRLADRRHRQDRRRPGGG